MNNNLIGEQITKFRKAADITQEELGKAAGVSTQAVSRWECGGAPDVSLLPAIADKLGVTIDDLFGREGGESGNIIEQVSRYVVSVPEGKRLDTLCRLLFRCLQFLVPLDFGFMGAPMEYLEKCTIQTDEGLGLLRSGMALKEGMMLGICSEELSFMSVFPEPESGWAAFFLDNDEYRKLFAVLALPNALEVLEFLYSEETHYIVPEAAAARMGIPVPEAEDIFVRLYEAKLLLRLKLELSSGMVYTYKINENYGFVPFLLIARCLVDSVGGYYIAWDDRKSPQLRSRAEKQQESGQEMSGKEMSDTEIN